MSDERLIVRFRKDMIVFEDGNTYLVDLGPMDEALQEFISRYEQSRPKPMDEPSNEEE